MKNAARVTYKVARRIVVLAVGTTVISIGVIMIVTPGPAIVVIPLGLAILSAEFAWARIWLKKLRAGISAQSADHRGRRAEHHRDRHR